MKKNWLRYTIFAIIFSGSLSVLAFGTTIDTVVTGVFGIIVALIYLFFPNICGGCKDDYTSNYDSKPKVKQKVYY